MDHYTLHSLHSFLPGWCLTILTKLDSQSQNLQREMERLGKIQTNSDSILCKLNVKNTQVSALEKQFAEQISLLKKSQEFLGEKHSETQKVVSILKVTTNGLKKLERKKQVVQKHINAVKEQVDTVKRQINTVMEKISFVDEKFLEWQLDLSQEKVDRLSKILTNSDSILRKLNLKNARISNLEKQFTEQIVLLKKSQELLGENHSEAQEVTNIVKAITNNLTKLERKKQVVQKHINAVKELIGFVNERLKQYDKYSALIADLIDVQTQLSEKQRCFFREYSLYKLRQALEDEKSGDIIPSPPIEFSLDYSRKQAICATRPHQGNKRKPIRVLIYEAFQDTLQDTTFDRFKRILRDELELSHEIDSLTLDSTELDYLLSSTYSSSPTTRSYSCLPNWDMGMGFSSTELEQIELILALEEEFDIEISDDEYERIFSRGQIVGNLFELIREKVIEKKFLK